MDKPSSGIDPADAHQYIANLTGVADAQRITVTLTGVTDSVGNSSASIAVTLGVLLGDVNGTGLVDGNDVSAVQGATRQTPDEGTFRFDVNCTGLIDGNDVSVTQGNTRAGLPAAAATSVPAQAPAAVPAEKKPSRQPLGRPVTRARGQSR